MLLFKLNFSQTNTFQCILASDGITSFVIFLYAERMIGWTTGDASDGVGGIGGIPAQVGFNAGDRNRSTVVPESRTGAIINITMTSNVDSEDRSRGQWIFRVDGEKIAAECSSDAVGE